jgi:hypothetical protein
MCARCFEMMVMMGVSAVIMTGAMFMFERGNAHRHYDRLEAELADKKFTISCTEEGFISSSNGDPNCIESNSFRVVRQGITTTVFQVGPDGDPKPVYRSGYSNGLEPSSGGMAAAAHAFATDQTPEAPRPSRPPPPEASGEKP